MKFQASSDLEFRKILITTAIGTAVSTLPSGYTSGTAFSVSIVVTPASSVSAYGVEDQVPANWVVSNISESEAFDAVNNKVKWGPFFDDTARTLSYTITPPANASGSASFAGSASFDGADVPVTGQRTISSGGGSPTAPTITVQPQSQTANAGSGVTFSVTATGTAPFSYQWKKDGTTLSGATGGTLVLSNVQSADAGSYTVVVSNSAGSVTSQAAVLTVNMAGALQVAVSSTSGSHNASILVPVRVTGFSNILSLQFSMHWDPAVAQFVGAEQFGTATLASGNFGSGSASTGSLTVSWDDTTGAGVTLADGTVFFALRFSLVGLAGTSSALTVNGTPTAIEAANVRSRRWISH